VLIGSVKITADQVICTVPDTSGGGGVDDPAMVEIELDKLLGQYADEIAAALQSVTEHAAELQLLTIKGYAVCNTAGNVAAKTVSITPFVLEVGSEVTVKFTYPNTAPAATLNVSSSAAKPIMYKGQPLPGGLLSGVQKFSYDGANWNIIGDFDTNTDTTYDVLTVAEATAGSAITPRTVTAANLNQIVTEISTDIVTAELANSYDVSGLQAQLNDLIFKLAMLGIIDGEGLDTVVTIDSASDIVLISGMYASGKVYI
jgi:hypothetical protein